MSDQQRTAAETLAQNAKCFWCVPRPTLLEVQTYLIAYASGRGVDPTALANLARCLECLGAVPLIDIKAYLLATLGGLSTDPNELAARASCYSCIPAGMMDAAQTYLLSTDPNGPGITDPSALIAAANAWQNIPTVTLLAIQVYSLALNAGVSTDPNELAELAKCLKCLPYPVLVGSITAILDEIEGPGGGGIVPVQCVDDPAQQVPVLQNPVYSVAGVLTSVDVRNPQTCCQPLRWNFYEANEEDGSDAVLWAQGVIGPTHAGEINYTRTLPIVLPFNRPYLYATQECADGTESGPSNVVWVGDEAAALVVANDWSTRVQANGGAVPSANSVNAIAQFWAELLWRGLTGEMKCINPIAPDSLIAARTPLVVGGGSDPWGTSGTLELQGMDGIWATVDNSYMTTGFNALAGFTSNANGGISCYMGSVRGCRTSFCAAGASVAANPNIVQLRPVDFAATAIVGAYPSTNSDMAPAQIDYGVGYYSVNCTASNARAMYFKGPRNAHASIASDAFNDATALPNFALFAMNRNVSGAPVAGDLIARRQTLSFLAFHDGLTSTQSGHFAIAIERLRYRFGGGFFNTPTDTASYVSKAWVNSITKRGGVAPSAATQTAVQTFWQSLITAGIQGKMIVIMPLVPDSLTAAIVPLYHTHGPSAWENNGFVAGDLTVNGLKGDGAKYLRGRMNSSDRFYPAYSLGITVYVYSGADEARRYCEWRRTNAASNGYGLINYSGSSYFGAEDTWGVGPIANGSWTGYLSGNRIANNDARIFRANSGTAHAQLGATGVGVVTDNRVTNDLGTGAFNTCILFGQGQGGVVSEISTHRLSFFALHQGLTTAESASFYNAIQALRTALGGGFV